MQFYASWAHMKAIKKVRENSAFTNSTHLSSNFFVTQIAHHTAACTRHLLLTAFRGFRVQQRYLQPSQ